MEQKVCLPKTGSIPHLKDNQEISYNAEAKECPNPESP